MTNTKVALTWKANFNKISMHFSWLCLWLTIGTILRFHNLGILPPWTDECATTVFSLGNSFQSVPTNQLINWETLLAPFQPLANAEVGDVLRNLQAESTHPPVYFVITHWWLKLFPLQAGYVSMMAVRSLAAILGVVAIPAMFGLGWFAFRCLKIAQFSAALMAVSPLGIYLATQARHYTLAILMVIAALACLVEGVASINQQKLLPIWLVYLWIIINSLGVATHYFFALGIVAQVLILLWQIKALFFNSYLSISPHQLRRIFAVITGSFIGCLVWLPSLATIGGRSATEWIYSSNLIARWLEPIARFPLWVASMLLMLPTSINDLSLVVVIIFALISLVLLLGIVPLLFTLIFTEIVNHENSLTPTATDTHFSNRSNLAVKTIGGYVLAVVTIFFLLTWGLGMDLTLAPRFHFVYFPGVILLIAFSLLKFSDRDKSTSKKSLSNSLTSAKFNIQYLVSSSRNTVILIAILALFSGIISAYNLGYLQHERPDLIIKEINKHTHLPTIVASSYQHHGHTGRLMGIAWEVRDFSQFFLIAKDVSTDSYEPGIKILQSQLLQVPKPLNLWLVNFRGKLNFENQGCVADEQHRKSMGQYHYQLYRCLDLPST